MQINRDVNVHVYVFECLDTQTLPSKIHSFSKKPLGLLQKMPDSIAVEKKVWCKPVTIFDILTKQKTT